MPAPVLQHVFRPLNLGLRSAKGLSDKAAHGFKLSGSNCRVSRWSFAVPRTTTVRERGGPGGLWADRTPAGGTATMDAIPTRSGRCWRSDHGGNRLCGGTASIHICSQSSAGSVRQKPPSTLESLVARRPGRAEHRWGLCVVPSATFERGRVLVSLQAAAFAAAIGGGVDIGPPI